VVGRPGVWVDEDATLHVDARPFLEAAGRCSCDGCQQTLIDELHRMAQYHEIAFVDTPDGS
jgi:hypothetical protein